MRTIVEEKWSSDALAQARETWSGADFAWEVVTWFVMRAPEDGDRISMTAPVFGRTVHGAKSIGMPTITILYRVEEFRIVVFDILFAEPTKWNPDAD